MKYTQDLRNKVLSATLTESIDEVARKFNLPPTLVKKWTEIDIPEERLKVRVRQKFYSLFPEVEAQIVMLFEDYIVCSITDDEWEDLQKSVNKVIFDTALKVYRAAKVEPKEENDTVQTALVTPPKPKKKVEQEDKSQLLFDFMTEN